MSRAAIVTGAASGIGRAVAERLARDGQRVVAVDVDAEGLAWTKDQEGVLPLAGDVTDPALNREAVALAEARFGRLDVLVLNAGGPAAVERERLRLGEVAASRRHPRRTQSIGAQDAGSV